MFFVLSIVDLLVLLFLSRLVTRSLSRLIHNTTHRLRLTVKIFSFLLLPGTLIHELSHLLVSRLLGVKTHAFVLTPVLEENTVRLGSISIEKTDPFRKTLIGIAPLLVGLALVVLLLWWVANRVEPAVWQILLVGYGIFQVSNTMFPSKADMTGAPQVVILLLGILIALLIIFGNGASFLIAIGSSTFFEQAVSYLTGVVGIDTVALTILHILLRLRR
ncbi:MAG: hypothetical protein Q8Q49_06325 [bacterium]|nr:hypothetical protein [bacterium]